ncbi:hypothetical protein BCR34DRAFT_663378 [Clohesyomyces aquaticus]|uniref:WD40-repeat-containing domain protein n=1 Tax=Clohesyomyces aquaticus TaxID=1231657 RepID=A0A1Y1ZSC0_9PLEO|nr:hypothetical protein BCR34DRAFT_663378 [Clohesyomyces aquaticus]
MGDSEDQYGVRGNQPLEQVLIKASLGTKHSDQDIRDISESLSRSGQKQWSKVPRIYVVLRSINQLHAIDTFLDNGISDVWFPFTQRTLPATFGSQTARNEFLEAQKNVLSEILDFEGATKHYHFPRGSDVPLIKLSELGRGHFGFVDRVRSEVSFREYARKLIPRGPNFRKNKVVLKDFENELGNLKKLSHIHTVQLKASYTDPQFVGIIMWPVADCNLKEYLEGPFESSLLRTFFGCLAVAVRFLHESCVRHKDIKPQNVLVYKGRVLLADFGISLDWSETGHSTTSGPTTKTARYCAPEVANYASRNSSSDIWSLGCFQNYATLGTLEMEVEATLRVWNEDDKHLLSEYDGQWEPVHLTHGEWYSRIPESVRIEDEQLRVSRHPSVRPREQRMNTNTEQFNEQESILDDLDLTNGLIPGLFYSGARYFLIRSDDARAIEDALARGAWSCNARVRNKLTRVMNAAPSLPILMFLFLRKKQSKRALSPSFGESTNGLFGFGVLKAVLDESLLASTRTKESLQINWLVKAFIPTTQFGHIRANNDPRAVDSNSTLNIVSYQDGTELSQYIATELLSLFKSSSSSLFPEPSRDWVTHDGKCTVLTNPHLSTVIDVTLHSSFSLESGGGDYALDISPDGKYVVGGCCVVEVFEIDTGARRWKFDEEALAGDEMHGASFSPDAKHLAVGGEKGKIHILDLDSGQLAGTLRGHEQPIFSLEYTRNGSYIVSGSEDKTVRVWDVSTLCQHAVFQLDGECVTISVSPELRVFAGTLHGKIASLGDITNLSTDIPPVLVEAHYDSTFSVHCLPNGTDIVTGSRDRSVKLWSYGAMGGSSGVDSMYSATREFLGHEVNASIPTKEFRQFRQRLGRW